MKYLKHYPSQLQNQVEDLIKKEKLGNYLISRYPTSHTYNSDKTLYSYVMDFKNEYFKKYQLSKVIYDGKINVIDNALGMHSFISRVQGNKLKSKNEIKIATIFKKVPEDFLEMIVIHELSHLKIKEHNKAFYKLCTHIQKDYHQVEFDLRVYLTYKDKFGKLY